MKERVLISPPMHSESLRSLSARSIDVAMITSTFQLIVESFREPSTATRNNEDLVIDLDFDHRLPDDDLQDPLVDELDFSVDEYEWFIQVKGEKIGSIRGAMADNLEDLDKPHHWIVSVSIEPNFPEYFAGQLLIRYPNELTRDLLLNDPDAYWVLWKDCHDRWEGLLPSIFQNRYSSLIAYIKAKIKAKGQIKLEIYDVNKSLF